MSATAYYEIEDDAPAKSGKASDAKYAPGEESPEADRKPAPNSEKKGEIIINYKNVDIERAERQVLKGIDFELHSGEFCYLVGRVGSGKSSLMKTMYADVPVNQASAAEVLGMDLVKMKKKKIPYLRRQIGIVFQDFQLLQDRSVASNLRFVLEATGWKKKSEINQRIEEVLNDVGMANKSYKMPHELSGGEQQRIVIARALLNRPRLILADEPTGNLDPQTGLQIIRLLHKLAADGHAVVMATHNMQLVEDFPARTVRCIDKSLKSLD